MNTKSYAAAVGTDGTRCVVWGIGSGNSLDEACYAARDDAKGWLEASHEPETATLEIVAIDAERFERIDDGDVSADDLVAYAPMHAMGI